MLSGDMTIESNWHELICAAWQKRQALWQGTDVDCFRLFHGYAEGARGVVIEKFNDAAVIDYKTDIRDSLPELNEALLDVFPFKNIIAKGHQSLGLNLKQRLHRLKGEDASVVCHEHALSFSIKLDAVHNPGLYLDARDSRRWIAQNSAGRRVLNLFAFTGSLGVSAASGKATEVVHLDRSQELLPRIEENCRVNGVEFDARNFLRGDIYRHLPRAIRAGQKFDGIILDPPPRVYPSPSMRHKARGQDFPVLIDLCTQLLNPGGWILGMLHHFNCPWDEFETEVVEASKGVLQPRVRMTSGIDFPEAEPERKLRVSVFYAADA